MLTFSVTRVDKKYFWFSELHIAVLPTVAHATSSVSLKLFFFFIERSKFDFLFVLNQKPTTHTMLIV